MPAQLSDMGALFLHILTNMKHNGAIDKTQAGFTSLVRRQVLNLCICLCLYCFHLGLDAVYHMSQHLLEALYHPPLHALWQGRHLL